MDTFLDDSTLVRFFHNERFYLWKKINRVERWYRRYLTYFPRKIVSFNFFLFHFQVQTWYPSNIGPLRYIYIIFAARSVHLIYIFDFSTRKSSRRWRSSSCYSLLLFVFNNMYPTLHESSDKLFETFLQIIHKLEYIFDLWQNCT